MFLISGFVKKDNLNDKLRGVLSLLMVACFASIYPSVRAEAAIKIQSEKKGPSAEDILARAQKDSIEYIKALGEMEQYAPYLSTPSQIYSYVMILDSLLAIGKEHKIDSIAGSPITIVAKVVTEQTIKFIDFSRDNEDFLNTFFRWAADDVRNSAIDEQYALAAVLTEKADMLKWIDRTEMVNQILQKYKAAHFVGVNIQTLQGNIARKLLQIHAPMSEAESLSFVGQLRSVSVINEILVDLQQKAYSSQNPSDHLYFIKMSLAAHQAIMNIADSKSSYLENLPRQNILFSLRVLLQSQVPLTAELGMQIATIFNHSTLVDLLLIVNETSTRQLTKKQSEFLEALVRVSLPMTQNWALPNEVLMYKRLYSRLLVKKLGIQNIEGSYMVMIDEGHDPVDLTIASLGNAEFLVDLGVEKKSSKLGTLDLSFSEVYYDMDKKAFIGNRFAVDNPHGGGLSSQNNHIEWKITEGEKIQGIYSVGNVYHRFYGFRTEKFEAYEEIGEDSMDTPGVSLEGIYTATGPSGEKFDLSITKTGAVYVANLQLEKSHFSIGLPYAQMRNNGKFWYFTSGEVLSVGRWFQLRAIKTEDGSWKSQFIVGGKGLKFKEILFTKKEEPGPIQ